MTLKLNSGYPYSLLRFGLPATYPKLEADIRTDVTVIGAGISGALTAHALVEAGFNCVMVDGRTVGLGSTCASSSLLQYEIDTPLVQLTRMIGEAPAQRAYQLCARSIGELETICNKIQDAYFEPKHSLYLASFKKHMPMLEAEFHARHAAGMDVSLWDEQQVHSLTGLTAPGAIYSRVAAQTDAYQLTHALHRYNTGKGMPLYDRTMIAHIDIQKKGAVLQTSEGVHIKTRYIVIAAGYESTRYLPPGIMKLHSTYVIASEHYERDTFWYNNCLIWETKQPYLYMRTTPDRRIIVGGRDEDYYNPSRRDKLLITKTRQLRRDFEKCFPDIAFTPEFAWTGTFGSTKDGLPYIGVYEKMPHTFFALGFGGNGITFSQIAANIVCGLLNGKKDPDADLFSFGR